jgi:hypothetical protein
MSKAVSTNYISTYRLNQKRDFIISLLESVPHEYSIIVNTIINQDLDTLAQYCTHIYQSSIRKIVAAFFYERCTAERVFVHLSQVREWMLISKKGHMKFHKMVQQDLLHSRNDRYTLEFLLPPIQVYFAEWVSLELIEPDHFENLVETSVTLISKNKDIIKKIEQDLPLLIALTCVQQIYPGFHLKAFCRLILTNQNNENSRKLIARAKNFIQTIAQ